MRRFSHADSSFPGGAIAARRSPVQPGGQRAAAPSRSRLSSLSFVAGRAIYAPGAATGGQESVRETRRMATKIGTSGRRQPARNGGGRPHPGRGRRRPDRGARSKRPDPGRGRQRHRSSATISSAAAASAGHSRRPTAMRVWLGTNLILAGAGRRSGLCRLRGRYGPRRQPATTPSNGYRGIRRQPERRAGGDRQGRWGGLAGRRRRSGF